MSQSIRRIEVTPRTMAYAALTVAACYIALRLWPVVLVAIASMLLVGTLNPIVGKLEARGIGRRWGIAIVFIIGLLAAVGICAITIPPLVAQVKALADQEPAIACAAGFSRWFRGSITSGFRGCS